jgi:hypothetical protein
MYAYGNTIRFVQKKIRKTIDIHDGHTYTLHTMMVGVGARPCGTGRQAGGGLHILRAHIPPSREEIR